MGIDVNMFNPTKHTFKRYIDKDREWYVLEFWSNEITVSIFYDKHSLETVKSLITLALENPETINVTEKT